jgi:hypothetical protein
MTSTGRERRSHNRARAGPRAPCAARSFALVSSKTVIRVGLSELITDPLITDYFGCNTQDYRARGRTRARGRLGGCLLRVTRTWRAFPRGGSPR